MSDWQPPQYFIRGSIVPNEVRTAMKQGDKLDLRGHGDGTGTWSLNGKEVFTGPIQYHVAL